ncbi:hypothetical protein [Miniphocaeibacter massiliensis]|uniref:hypothetical protein n=1 Tax=Miniphocaeibacter massiliensis TaxID=2041841 RepID=UPI000C1B8EA5|nr:hypothetical protein [Miniphocaeibacter massiliensis]
MDIFMDIFGGTIFLATILFILFLYKTIKNEGVRINNEIASNVLDDTVEIAFRVVVNLTQTTVEELKENDRWDTGMARGIFKQALQEVKYQLGEYKLKLLGEKVVDTDAYLSSLIESIVYETKV